MSKWVVGTDKACDVVRAALRMDLTSKLQCYYLGLAISSRFVSISFHHPLLSAANWLKPPDLDQKKHQTPRYLTRSYWHNNSRKLLFLCGYTCLNVLLFVVAMLRHSYGGGWFMVAKGCGQCLNFNCTFIMVRQYPGPLL